MKLYNLIFSAINQIKFLIFETVFYFSKRQKEICQLMIIQLLIILPTYNRSEMLKSRSALSVLNRVAKILD